MNTSPSSIPLTPLESLFDVERSKNLPLPPELARLFGSLQIPSHVESPYIIGNFVTTLDGVAAFGETEKIGGGQISGFNQHDRMVMGLLRAIADVVIVGAGTLRAEPKHRWTAEYIYPSFAHLYKVLRNNMGKAGTPLNVIVTARGEVNLELPVFQSGEVEVLIVTTNMGLQRLREQRVPATVVVEPVQGRGPIRAEAILEVVKSVRQSEIILVEGGPHLMGSFFAEHRLDELFLTLAPQVAGRDSSSERPGLVASQLFAPENPLWGTLVGVKRGGSHLFLRYTFDEKFA